MPCALHTAVEANTRPLLSIYVILEGTLRWCSSVQCLVHADWHALVPRARSSTRGRSVPSTPRSGNCHLIVIGFSCSSQLIRLLSPYTDGSGSRGALKSRLEGESVSTETVQTIGVDGSEYRYSLTRTNEAQMYTRVIGPGLHPWLEVGLPHGLREAEFEKNLRMRIQIALSCGCGM